MELPRVSSGQCYSSCYVGVELPTRHVQEIFIRKQCSGPSSRRACGMTLMCVGLRAVDCVCACEACEARALCSARQSFRKPVENPGNACILDVLAANGRQSNGVEHQLGLPPTLAETCRDLPVCTVCRTEHGEGCGTLRLRGLDVAAAAAQAFQAMRCAYMASAPPLSLPAAFSSPQSAPPHDTLPPSLVQSGRVPACVASHSRSG